MKRKCSTFYSVLLMFLLPVLMWAGGGQEAAKTTGPSDVHIYGVKWQTEWNNEMLDAWEKDHPDITVTFHGEANYYDKVLILLMTNPEKVDICVLNPGYLMPWVSAGWIVPLDDFPRADERKGKMRPTQLQQYTYKGKLYAGGAWYQLTPLMVYNRRILDEAGISSPPTTWDGIIEDSLTIKRAGIVEYPLALYYKPTSRRLDWVWATIATNLAGADKRPLWDENFNPQFLQSSSPGYRALQYVRDFIQKHKITSPGAFEVDTFDVVNAMMRGQAAFSWAGDFHFSTIADPEKNQEHGNIQPMVFPNTGYTWSKADGYAMSVGATKKGEKHKSDSWEVLEYFTGPEYAKLRLKKWFGPSIYPEVYEDPEIQEVVKKFMPNPDVYYKQLGQTLNLQAVVEPVHRTPFYFQYLENYVLPNLQKAANDTITVDEALKAIHTGFESLKSEYGL